MEVRGRGFHTAVMQLLLVCIGGAVGSGARYLLSECLARSLGTAFPYGTLAVNLIGSFLVAALMVAGTETTALSPNVRLAATVGVLGGFTTYSAFSFEVLKALQEGRALAAAVNVIATLAGGLLAGLAGWFCARALLPH